MSRDCPFRPGEQWTLNLSEAASISLRWVPPGELLMGERGRRASEEPVHRVRITRGFWLGETPVTREQYGALGGDLGGKQGALDHPMNAITWAEARGFCRRTGQLAGRQWFGELPSEAQWEHACRAGTESAYWSGDDEAALNDVGWYTGNSGADMYPVGRKPANPWGLFDMHGNVWEWCRDAWDQMAYRGREENMADPFVDGSRDARRVMRGGSIWNSMESSRSAFRDWGRPDVRYRILGFRVGLFRRPEDSS